MNHLREFRKRNLNKTGERELNKYLIIKNDKWYIEKVYQKNKVFKYLLFLRKKGADLNKLFDKFEL